MIRVVFVLGVIILSFGVAAAQEILKKTGQEVSLEEISNVDHFMTHLPASDT